MYIINKDYFIYLLEKDMCSTFEIFKSSLDKIVESEDWYRYHDISRICEVMDRMSRKVESIKYHIDQLNEMEESGFIEKLSLEDIIDRDI